MVGLKLKVLKVLGGDGRRYPRQSENGESDDNHKTIRERERERDGQKGEGEWSTGFSGKGGRDKARHERDAREDNSCQKPPFPLS
jgi:hypothetical protein